LGGEAAFAAVAEHDCQFIEPKGDVIQAFLPKDKPSLILMDEVINYTSTYRQRGYHRALCNFIQSLSEQARGSDGVVLLVSIPPSEMPHSSEDEADERWFKKILDRVGKPVMMAAEAETAEIICRRLFEGQGLTEDARRTIAKYADEEARKLLAWEDIQDEAADLKLDETQRRQLTEDFGKSRRDLREAVWRAYKTVMPLGKDNTIRSIDLGLVHSSAADSLVGFIMNRLQQDGDISEGISP
jgi:hypothetical protein